jgi:hypothetical protein
MAESNNNKNKQLQGANTFCASCLDAAQIALGIGAFFGFLAVVGLVVLAWQFVLVLASMAIAMIALVIAVMLLVIPPGSPLNETVK